MGRYIPRQSVTRGRCAVIDRLVCVARERSGVSGGFGVRFGCRSRDVLVAWAGNAWPKRRFGSSDRTVRSAQRCFSSTARGGVVIASLAQVRSPVVQVRRAACRMRCRSMSGQLVAHAGQLITRASQFITRSRQLAVRSHQLITQPRHLATRSHHLIISSRLPWSRPWGPPGGVG